MKARFFPAPPKTISRGSSPTSRVRTTRPLDPPWDSATTLTLSERWLTTQTSSSLRAATATGSRPTVMEARCSRPLFPTRKTSRRLSGVLAAKRSLPLGDSARGRTWPLSKSVKLPPALLRSGGRTAAPAACTATRQARTDSRAIRGEIERRARYGKAMEASFRRSYPLHPRTPQGKGRFSLGNQRATNCPKVLTPGIPASPHPFSEIFWR